MEKIMVSACLLGINCKYNASNNYSVEVIEYLRDKDYIIICPEEHGGLKTPREPSEIEEGKEGIDVINGHAKVFDVKGEDVTLNFIEGARKTLELAKKSRVKLAILKESSPSCGSNKVFDGTFSGIKKDGKGVTTALLEKNNIIVKSEKTL